MKTKPYWLELHSRPQFSRLSGNLSVDVAVVGGGVTGITAAYLLKKAGYKVALLERDRWGLVDTGHTTAHLTCVTDKRLHKLAADFGKDAAKATWEAGFAAIDQIAANIQNEAIKCDFRWVPGYLYQASNAEADERSSLETDARLARDFGFQAQFVNSVPYFERPGVKFENQAKFHPMRYLSALAKTIPGRGSHIFEHAAAEEFKEKPLSVKASNHVISCDYIVLATHNPLIGIAGTASATLFQTKLSLYTSYVIGAKLPKGLVPEASFWDTADPYHYLRIDRRRSFDFAILGGEDHKTGQEADTELAYRRLEQKLHEMIPSADPTHRWSGQVIETNDGLPFIGQNASRQFIATGFAGNGFTFGTLSAMMAVDAFLKRKNPWAELFNVNRKKVQGGLWEYLKENKDYPYYMLRDWTASAQGESLQELKKNQGKILSLDGKKVAAYRDENGNVTLRSPMCTHLKCIVGWNRAEKTWDCPCHGSRFKATGEVLAGPAEQDLEEISVPKAARF
jgi:glycine/D-amino acid oxidase-like deaminating enzyme/nitrite reductase/ring-hydroxylating ferredoxin subunit